VIAAWRTTLVYRLVRTIIDLLLGLLTRREYVGLENIPPTPPYILAINHVSVLDSPALLTVCPHTVRAFAAAKHRRHPIYAPLLTLMGSIWVRRGEIDRHALKEALAALERGEVLGLAPEGTRSRDLHALQEGKSGVAYLATRANVPIVPVGVTGTEEIISSLLRLHRARVRIVVGQPFFLPENGRVRGQQLREYTDLVMRRIAALLPEEYRGVYS
jgi:1-acyl-sn-glycerol-3-phosphate acyltransferase